MKLQFIQQESKQNEKVVLGLDFMGVFGVLHDVYICHSTLGMYALNVTCSNK